MPIDAPGDSIAGVRERLPFPHVERIAVLRGGGLGDLVFALPALHALHETYPQSEITLLGAPMHAELLRGRPGPPDEVVVVPPHEGVRPGAVDERTTESFFADMRARRFDLAVQLHGGGLHSNPFLLRLDARHTIGTRTPDAVGLERTIPYVYYQNEFARGLEVVALAGARPAASGLEPVLECAQGSGENAVPARPRRERDEVLAVVHPGATDPRRRWPVGDFARVAGGLSRAGCTVVIVGDAGERRLCDEIVRRARKEQGSGRITSVAGLLGLRELLDLLADADVVVANDSGPRHLAQAMGTATVGVFWIGNLINAGPLTRERHRVHLGWTTRCPVCDVDCTQSAPRCEHDVSFVADVPWRGVLESALDLLAGR